MEYVPPPGPRAATTNQRNEPLWQRPTIERLLTLLDLEPGWDGPGSVAPSLGSAQNLMVLLNGLLRPTTLPPSIAPVSDGRLQAAWYDAGLELEITVDDEGRPDIGLFNVTTGADEDDVTLSDPRLAEAIARLSAT